MTTSERLKDSGKYPKALLLDSGNACNLRCSICDHRHMAREIGTMNPRLFRRIIDETAEKAPDTRVWLIFFGEPCLVKDMHWRIWYAKSKGLTDVVLNSNGVLLKKDIAKGYVEAGLDALYIGIDAATAGTYAKIRVGGDYQSVMANTLAYDTILLALGTTKQKVYAQFVVTAENEHEVENFKRFWGKYGIGVKIRPMVSWAGLVERTGGPEVGPRYACHWAMQTMSVCWDGRVALCACDVHCREACGDLNDSTVEQTWRWGIPAVQRQLHVAEDWKSLPEMCRKCQDWACASSEVY